MNISKTEAVSRFGSESREGHGTSEPWPGTSQEMWPCRILENALMMLGVGWAIFGLGVNSGFEYIEGDQQLYAATKPVGNNWIVVLAGWNSDSLDRSQQQFCQIRDLKFIVFFFPKLFFWAPHVVVKSHKKPIDSPRNGNPRLSCCSFHMPRLEPRLSWSIAGNLQQLNSGAGWTLNTLVSVEIPIDCGSNNLENRWDSRESVPKKIIYGNTG